MMLLKNRILRFLCALCAVSIALAQLQAIPLADSDTDIGKMSSVYGYVLDDYIRTYGVISSEYPHGSPDSEYGTTGVIYGDTVQLDSSLPPYLLIYLTEAKYQTASCHIWKYNEHLKKAERVAILEKNYNDITDCNGEFSLGWTDNKKYVVYKEYRHGELCNSEYYTAVGNDAFRYVNNPEFVNETGIMDFNRYYFNCDVDVSFYNKALSDFYDTLKNSAADSISLENFADRLDKNDESALEAAAARAVGFKSFDISDYGSIAEYEHAVKSLDATDKFYLITHFYNLGDEIYYMRFSTDRSYYNYALLRKTDVADGGYQLLKIRTDCIPLSGSELAEIKEKYLKNNLLYKKSRKTIKALKTEEAKPARKAKIHIEKKLDRRIRIPSACIGGAAVILLATLLWIKLYSDDNS